MQGPPSHTPGNGRRSFFLSSLAQDTASPFHSTSGRLCRTPSPSPAPALAHPSSRVRAIHTRTRRIHTRSCSPAMCWTAGSAPPLGRSSPTWQPKWPPTDCTPWCRTWCVRQGYETVTVTAARVLAVWAPLRPGSHSAPSITPLAGNAPSLHALLQLLLNPNPKQIKFIENLTNVYVRYNRRRLKGAKASPSDRDLGLHENGLTRPQAQPWASVRACACVCVRARARVCACVCAQGPEDTHTALSCLFNVLLDVCKVRAPTCQTHTCTCARTPLPPCRCPLHVPSLRFPFTCMNSSLQSSPENVRFHASYVQLAAPWDALPSQLRPSYAINTIWQHN